MVQRSGMAGTLSTVFADGYLVESIDEATMTEEIEMLGEVSSMAVYSKQATYVSYDFEAVYPDLSEYTKLELEA